MPIKKFNILQLAFEKNSDIFIVLKFTVVVKFQTILENVEMMSEG